MSYPASQIGTADSRLLPVAMACLAALPLFSGSRAFAEPVPDYNEIQPLVEKYCYECHGGNKTEAALDLTKSKDFASVLNDRKQWVLALDAIDFGEMPPKKAAQPSKAERAQLVDWLSQHVLNFDAEKFKSPGPGMVRRLTIAEYRNTMRDLMGLKSDVVAEAGIQPEDPGEHFDTQANHLSVSPLLMEKYLAAADAMLARIVPTSGKEALLDREASARLFFTRPVEGQNPAVAANQIIHRFAAWAFRRPLEEEELARFMQIFQLAQSKNYSFEESIRAPLRAVLIHPNFLYRIEQDRNVPPGQSYPVTDFELAARLSYFLWSSMPDAELFALADRGELRQPGVLMQQVDRMIRDPKAERFIRNFGGQWLGFRKLDAALPEQRYFPDFTPEIRDAMAQETASFLMHLLRSNGSIYEILDADYTFLNRQLAEYYYPPDDYAEPPIEMPAGDEFQKVSLKAEADRRGGILGHGSFHALTSFPDRTSPSERGKWVLGHILGTPPPPPPPNASFFDEDEVQQKQPKNFREKLAMHASEPACAGCHAKMDPIGFALDNFDPVGRWREEVSGEAIDTFGKLPSGETFKGVDGFKALLMNNREEFARNLVDQLLRYALGRELAGYDEFAARKAVKELQENGNGFASAIKAVVNSYPFQHRINSQGVGTSPVANTNSSLTQPAVQAVQLEPSNNPQQ